MFLNLKKKISYKITRRQNFIQKLENYSQQLWTTNKLVFNKKQRLRYVKLIKVVVNFPTPASGQSKLPILQYNSRILFGFSFRLWILKHFQTHIRFYPHLFLHSSHLENITKNVFAHSVHSCDVSTDLLSEKFTSLNTKSNLDKF